MIEHPASEEVAAYLSGTLQESERSSLEAHLVQCQACRQEVTAARTLLHRQNTRKRLFWVPLAMAAVVGGVLLYSPAAPSNAAESLRGDTAAGTAAEVQLRVAALSPREGDRVAPDELEFRWASEGAAARYRVTLRDAGGRPLWNRETTDTSAMLDSSVVLLPGSTYFWYVDALRLDGQSLTSGTVRFSTAP
jgi:anti-sigma factor RsiW